MAHIGLLFAHDKGPGYSSNTTPAQRIQDLQTFYGLPKWGFVLYRCTYGDDERWHRFLARLTTHRDAVLRDHYHLPALADSHDWAVQDDASLNGATRDEVRRRFRRWVAADAAAEIPDGMDDSTKAGLMSENPRYNYCVLVDAEAMSSVLQQAPVLGGEDGPITGHVTLIRADEDWDLPDFDRFDWSMHGAADAIADDGEDDEGEDEYDEGEPALEGSRLRDVGWMRVGVDSLVPETYATLTKGFMWDKLYCRPPKVMER
ncbi:hypothetical protein LTR53_015798 [Teratosphaeriaceae sp. CCFEE 6253]|nr:hypothetical protein LTR53_015798 [Teratosphaeriaceae sp. CCFEE 6253]